MSITDSRLVDDDGNEIPHRLYLKRMVKRRWRKPKAVLTEIVVGAPLRVGDVVVCRVEGPTDA